MFWLLWRDGADAVMLHDLLPEAVGDLVPLTALVGDGNVDHEADVLDVSGVPDAGRCLPVGNAHERCVVAHVLDFLELVERPFTFLRAVEHDAMVGYDNSALAGHDGARLPLTGTPFKKHAADRRQHPLIAPQLRSDEM